MQHDWYEDLALSTLQNLSPDTPRYRFATRQALLGYTFISPQLAANLSHYLVPREAEPAVDLTYREQEVFDLLLSGLANEEISQKLHISLATAKNTLLHY